MDLTSLVQSLQTSVGTHLPSILGALGILVAGWIIAVLVRAAARRAFHGINLDQRLASSTGLKVGVSNGVATGVFWLIMVFTLIAVLNALNLSAASGPFATLANVVMGFVPQLIAAAVLVLVAWVCATLIRSVAGKLLAATSLNEKVGGNTEATPMSLQLSQVLYWLTFLLFLPAILGALQLSGLLEPVQGMMNSLLGILPNILGALVIGLVGFLVAKVLCTIVTGLLTSAGADRAGEKLGLGSFKPATLAGTVVFVLILLPTLIAALDALKIEAISKPASDMLSQVFEAVPNIVAAVLILALTFFIARMIAGIVSQLLAELGVDGLPTKLGLTSNPQAGMRLSDLVGKALIFFAMLFAAAEAANRIGFGKVSELAASLVAFSGDVVLGGVILVAGFWLANLAHDAIARAAGVQDSPLARIARITILGLVLAMGLRAMGIAPDIVNLAFGLILGAIAVASALSFGLGGREAAGKQLEHWLAGWRDTEKRNLEAKASGK